MSFVALIPSATLVVMMFAMGLGLAPADFARVVAQPRAVLLGVLGQLVLLPAVALAISISLSLPPPIAVGLVLVAACPGGSTSNALSHLARGDVPLSITLTAISSLLAFAWIPAVLTLALHIVGREDGGISLPFGDAAFRLGLTTAAPLFAGMAVRRLRAGFADRWRAPLLNGSIGVLLVLIAGLPFGLASQGVEIGALFHGAIGPVLLLLASTIGIALLAGRTARLERPQRVTLALEVGIQNFNLAMVVALQLLQEPALLGTAIVYLPAMILSGGALVAHGRRADRLRGRVARA